MSELLLQIAQGVIQGTFRTAAFTIDGVFTVFEAIAGRKVGVYVLPVATINEMSTEPDDIVDLKF